MMYRKQDFVGRGHSPLQKALHFGKQAVALGVTLKGIYDTGSAIFNGVRAIAPVVAPALAAFA